MTKKMCYPWGDKITSNPVFFIMAHENPNWPEANLLAIYKCVLEIEHETTENMQMQSAVKARVELEAFNSSALTAQPSCLADYAEVFLFRD